MDVHPPQNGIAIGYAPWPCHTVTIDLFQRDELGCLEPLSNWPLSTCNQRLTASALALGKIWAGSLATLFGCVKGKPAGKPIPFWEGSPKKDTPVACERAKTLSWKGHKLWRRPVKKDTTGQSTTIFFKLPRLEVTCLRLESQV